MNDEIKVIHELMTEVLAGRYSHSAFDALLAVAKAAEVGPVNCPICSVFPEVTGQPVHSVSCPYAVLSAAHPGWRDWA